MQTIFLYHKNVLVKEGMSFTKDNTLYQVISIDFENLTIKVTDTKEVKDIHYNDLSLDFEFIIFTKHSKISRKP